MAIISRNNSGVIQGYAISQLRYAISYVIITLVVLLFINLYTNTSSQRLLYESKEEAMVEKCLLAAEEIAKQDVMSPSTVANAVNQMGSLKANRLIVTDQAGICLYDSIGQAFGVPVLLPELLEALAGKDVFSWQYKGGFMISKAAVPIQYYGTTIGCVYINELDTTQGQVIIALQQNILRMTVVLEFVVILFSLAYSGGFSSRMRKIMASIRDIQQENYNQRVAVGGHDELTMLAEEFNMLTERLQTSEEKRNRFVSDASHELKTPLASIKLLTDSILQNDMDTETMREFVGDIGSEADRLTRMTEKLLSLVKIGKEPETEMELISMAPTVQAVAKMLEPIARKADISLHVDTDTPCTVLMLEDDLYQVVFNLMENGIKYNRPGGSLTVRISRQEDTAVLTVQDTGMGISEEGLSHIFERFYRVDKARSRATGGSGLGLAIVRAIVQRNRGEIRVESQVGAGSTFILTLPIFETGEAET